MQNLWGWLTGDGLKAINPGPRSGGGGGGYGSGSGQNAQQNTNQNNDCGAESLGQLLDRKGAEAYENSNYASWIGLGFLNAAYKVFTPGSDSLSQLNARAWNGEVISGTELVGTGLLATAQVGLVAGPGIIANNVTIGTWFYNLTGGSKMLTGNPYLRIGWSHHGSNHTFRIASDIGGKTKIDLLKGPMRGCGKGK
jgi:hypothetical protein